MTSVFISYVLRKVVRGMTSLFDQTERKRDTHATKTPDLASSRPPDEFHVSHGEEQFEKLIELWRMHFSRMW